MRENCTLRLCYATASQAGSMRGIRRKTAKSVLRVAEGRAGAPHGGVPLYSTRHSIPGTLHAVAYCNLHGLWESEVSYK